MSHSTTPADVLEALSVHRLRRLVDGLTDAAVVVDKDLRPLVWNAAYVQAVGLRPRRFQEVAGAEGMRCRDLLGLEVCEKECLAKACLKGQRPVRMDEIQGRSEQSPGAEASTLIVSAIPLENVAGETVAVLEVYRDVTAEARIQARYKVLLDRERRRAEILEEQVRARTADLERSLEELRATRAQLIQSEKLSSLGQLVAGIAHEINNPINFIYGNTDFLQQYVDAFLRLIDAYDKLEIAAEDRKRIENVKTEIDFSYLVQDTRKLLRSIRNGSERASAIIRDLRAFIHGRPMERSPVDLVKCIEQTLNLLTHEVRDRISVKREGSEQVPTVLCNEGQINQVFMNLLLNAIQAIQGRGTITIRFYERDGGVAVDVTDTGVGIPDATLLKVFDPFFTTKPVGEGTGLGLSLSYSIVDAHGGKISAQSKVGVGSTFTVWLPRDVQPKVRGAEEHARASS